jgi:Lrp/AsnC family leucine-responsive transcriptional regulator
MKFDKKDIQLMNELQKDCRQSLKKLARKLDMSITTIYDRIKKLEKEGVIKSYMALLDPDKVDKPVIAFIFIRIQYYPPDSPEPLSQREIAKKIAMISEVSEVHIIGGEWDILIKARGKDLKEIGTLVIDKLRKIKGVDRTLTTHSWVPVKENPEIFLHAVPLE